MRAGSPLPPPLFGGVEVGATHPKLKEDERTYKVL